MDSNTSGLIDVRAQWWCQPTERDGILGWYSGSRVPPSRALPFAQELLDSAICRPLDCSLSIVIGGRVVWRRVGEQLTLPGVAE